MENESKKAAKIYAAWRERELGGEPVGGHIRESRRGMDGATRMQHHGEADKENTPENTSHAPVTIKSTIQRRFKVFRRRSQGIPITDSCLVADQLAPAGRQSTGTCLIFRCSCLGVSRTPLDTRLRRSNVRNAAEGKGVDVALSFCRETKTGGARTRGTNHGAP